VTWFMNYDFLKIKVKISKIFFKWKTKQFLIWDLYNKTNKYV